MQLQFTAVFEKVPEGYIGFVEELPGANTQASTLDEARTNLGEAVRLVLEANRSLAEEAIGGLSFASPVACPPLEAAREINDFLAKKICRDLEVPEP